MKYAANYIGKQKRLFNILGTEGKCVLVPLDDNLISGPCTGVENWINKLHQIESAAPSAILAYQGTLMQIDDVSIPKILNLTASTIRNSHTNKVLINNLEYALKMNVDAVAVHVNISSKYESNMLEILGRISEQCDEYGMPLLAIIYPRSESTDENYIKLKENDNEKYTELVCHCVRVAFEMGADIIKTQYTGTKQSFMRVIQSANCCPVVIAGGGIMKENNLFYMVEDAMEAGAAGVSIGRNVFGRSNSDLIITGIKDIVFGRMTAEQVIKKMV